MTGFLIAAAVAAVVAGFFLWQAQQAKGRKARLLAVETTSTGQLKALVDAAAEAAGPGAFAQPVELAGTAVAGPGGLLTSELSETPCVWHQHKVTHKYRERYKDRNGNRKTRTKEEVVTDHRSEVPFLLRDADGEIVVVPTRNVQGGRKVVSRFEDDDGDEPRTELKIGSFSLNLPTSRGDETIGYEYEEWVLLPDAKIFVQGEASDDGGQLEVREPRGKATLLISTRSEAALLDSAEKGIASNTRIAAGAGVLAVVLAVVGVVVGLV